MHALADGGRGAPELRRPYEPSTVALFESLITRVRGWLPAISEDAAFVVASRPVVMTLGYVGDPVLEAAAPWLRRSLLRGIDEQLAVWTKDQDVTELAELLAREGVPAGVVVDARDIAHNPQLLHRNFFETEHHPVAGDVKLPAGAWKFASNHEPWMRRAAPTLGQHNDEVFRELLGLSDAELDRANTVSLNSDAPLTCQFFIEDHAMRHSYHHIAKIRGALAAAKLAVA